MGQINQGIEVGKGKALEDRFGLIGWLIPIFVGCSVCQPVFAGVNETGRRRQILRVRFGSHRAVAGESLSRGAQRGIPEGAVWSGSDHRAVPVE